jgi:excisionase family DNA binding protein
VKTLSLNEAALLLKMSPEVLRRKAATGEIPAAKPSKRWCFCEEDLVRYVRSLYATPVKSPWGVVETKKETTWHSTKEVIRGGSPLPEKVREYNDLLGLPAK